MLFPVMWSFKSSCRLALLCQSMFHQRPVCEEGQHSFQLSGYPALSTKLWAPAASLSSQAWQSEGSDLGISAVHLAALAVFNVHLRAGC